MDATLNYHADSVKTVFVPITQASLALKLDHGLLTIDPVAFSLPQGRLWAQVSLNARSTVPVTDADVRLSNVNLQEFTPHAKGEPSPIEGILAARGEADRGAATACTRRRRAPTGRSPLSSPAARCAVRSARAFGRQRGEEGPQPASLQEQG